MLPDNVDVIEIVQNDSWFRDCGPTVRPIPTNLQDAQESN